MLKTIRSKVIALTLSLLLVLCALMTLIMILNFNSTEERLIKGSQSNIETFAEQVNKEILKLENNALDLALMGELYYQQNPHNDLARSMIPQVFENYPHSLGGGVWFKPFHLDSKHRLRCVYAFRTEQGQIRLDPDFESEQYNYPTQTWYQEIMPQLEQGQKIAWSKPYYEAEGSRSLMMTVGAGIYHRGKLIGLSTVDWDIDSIIQTLSNIKPTENSFTLLLDGHHDSIISTTDKTLDNRRVLGKSVQLIPWYSAHLEQDKVLTYHNRTYIPYVRKLDNQMELIVNIPRDELFKSSLYFMWIGWVILILTSGFISFLIYVILKKNINQPIEQLMQMAIKIGRGQLHTSLQIKAPEELSRLAQTLNHMTHSLRANLTRIAHISQAKEKIESELSIARNIQSSALPKNFPVHTAFDLIASMTPAKAVGGDFYDFFLIDKTHFAFVMADVSGKGITAALYMMSAKTMIKNILKAGYPLAEVADKVNQGLYENNSRGMFVTAFIGVLNLKTGLVQYINAGHCPPLIEHHQKYRYLVPVRNLMLGVMLNNPYQVGQFTLQPTDRLFLYTDGVTEAQTKSEKLFGKERLLRVLNQKMTSLSETLERVQHDIKIFTKGAEQSDDITMMELLYCGNLEHTATFAAKTESWPAAYRFLEKELKTLSKSKRLSVLLSAEEIFSNIAKYAYRENGTIRMFVQINRRDITLQFQDWGKKYNLKAFHGKRTVLGKSQKIGGLGLYLVQNRTHQMKYTHKNGQNTLTLKFTRRASTK